MGQCNFEGNLDLVMLYVFDFRAASLIGKRARMSLSRQLRRSKSISREDLLELLQKLFKMTPSSISSPLLLVSIVTVHCMMCISVPQ
jgi:hypothetical protein